MTEAKLTTKPLAKIKAVQKAKENDYEFED